MYRRPIFLYMFTYCVLFVCEHVHMYMYIYMYYAPVRLGWDQLFFLLFQLVCYTHVFPCIFMDIIIHVHLGYILLCRLLHYLHDHARAAGPEAHVHVCK